MRLAALTLAALLAGCAQPEGTISYDLGGRVYAYSQKYADWDNRGVPARITGVCGSACTLVLRNKDICYDADAQFIFHGVSHKGEYDARASEAFKSAMPAGIQRWAEATGAFDSTQTVSISGRDLAAIDGRMCG